MIRLHRSCSQTGQRSCPDGLEEVPAAATDAFSADLHCVSFGVPFRLHCPRPELHAAILGELPHSTALLHESPDGVEVFSVLSPDGSHGFRSLAGQQQTAESADLAPVLEQLRRDLMVHVANFAPDRVFVHAGVLGWQGRAILLPGASFAGKTTLTAALVRAGATYYSDEYAVLDETGLVHPYSRDLQMRQPGRPEQRALSVAALAGTSGSEPLRASTIVFAQYRAGALWSPRPVSPGMAVLEMLRHSIPVQRTPARVMAALAAAVAEAAVWQTERDEASEAASALLDLCA